MTTLTVEQARKALRKKMKDAGLNPRKDLWTWTEDRRWWQVAVTQLGLDAWVYADNAAHAKNIAALEWMND